MRVDTIGSMNLPVATELLRERFDDERIKALVLLGSHVRGESARFSDIDLFRFLAVDDERAAQSQSHLINAQLVVVTNIDLARVEQWFAQPELAVEIVAGLQDGQAIIDREQTFATIRARAAAFVWDAAMQQRANRWLSEEMVGWIEEVHKILNGLLHNDLGRLLAARRGLTWGMLRLITSAARRDGTQ